MKYFITSPKVMTPKTIFLSLPNALALMDKEGFRNGKIDREGIYCIEFPYGFFTRFLYIVVKAPSVWFEGSERLYVELIMSEDYNEGRRSGEFISEPVYKELMLVSRLIRGEDSGATWEQWGKTHRWIRIGQ